MPDPLRGSNRPVCAVIGEEFKNDLEPRSGVYRGSATLPLLFPSSTDANWYIVRLVTPCRVRVTFLDETESHF